jgi:MbtH protein
MRAEADAETGGRPALVLVNAEGQHALYPAAKAVPVGWETVYGPADRAACLAFVETAWTDIRPRGPVTPRNAKTDHLPPRPANEEP